MIVIDLQTTGWDERKDAVVSIGAVDFDKPTRQFYGECKLSPGAAISDEASRAFKFDTASLFDNRKPDAEQVVKEFLSWSEGSELRTLAGQNPWFDAAFLKAAVDRFNFRWKFGYRHVDLHSIYFARLANLGREIPMQKHLDALSLGNILKGVGLVYGPGRHSSLENAKLEAEAFARLMYGKTLLKEFARCEIPQHLVRHRGKA